MNTQSKLISLALTIAIKAHDGQYRRNGEPYVFHPIRVAEILATQGETDEIIATALLHDVIEDNPQMGRLLQNLGNANVTTAVIAISKRPGEAYEDYINAITYNVIARKVKIADIKDNLYGPDSAPSETQQKRYLAALKVLEGV